MARKRSKPERDDPLAAYRRVRKPMPPPTRTDEDRRRAALDDVQRREAREAADDAMSGRGRPEGDGPAVASDDRRGS